MPSNRQLVRLPPARATAAIQRGGNWLDRVIGWLAPTWGQRRMESRIRTSLMARHYDAAAGGRRTAGWHRRATDANAAAQGSLVSLRELARDLVRNNGWARRSIQVIANNTVGWGIEGKPLTQSPDLAKRAQDVWRAWSTSARSDFDGRMPFSGLQRLVMETVALSGEALVVREPASTRDGLPVPVRLRVLEPDFLDVARDGVNGEQGPIVQGVEFDKRGRRVAYWLYRNHPGATGSMALSRSSFVSERVPATDVIHVYRLERPGQVRGVSWLAAAIGKLHDLEEYNDARLMQARIAACFGAFVQDLDGVAVGEQDATDDALEALEPGHISYLPPGKTVTFATPPSAGDLGPFAEVSLRSIAATVGITYEDQTGDFSRVNFSSARMGRLAHWANVHDWRWHMLIPQLCDGAWNWVMEEAAALEGWTEVPRAEWAPPPMPMLEPDKEGLAYARLVRSGILTLYQALREQGYDPESHLAEIAAGNAKLDELGIVLDSDPRRTTSSGQAQASKDASAGDDDEDAAPADDDADDDAENADA